jgi:hydrogenase/urease accessory protein HupE
MLWIFAYTRWPAFFALCHGHAHGAELPLAADPADYAIGFVLATGMIHLFGIGVGLGLNKPVGGRLARALGAVFALREFTPKNRVILAHTRRKTLRR